MKLFTIFQDKHEHFRPYFFFSATLTGAPTKELALVIIL